LATIILTVEYLTLNDIDDLSKPTLTVFLDKGLSEITNLIPFITGYAFADAVDTRTIPVWPTAVELIVSIVFKAMPPEY